MNIQNQKLDAGSAGAKVTYIPAHALGDAEHPDIEEGTISSWNNEFVFVDYGMGKGQATYPNDLVWNHVVGVNKMVEHGREKGKYAPKIIQILIAPNDSTWQGILVGLGDDGITYQVGTGTKWEPMIDALATRKQPK